MKCSDFSKTYKELAAIERAELVAAIKAYGGEYVFPSEDEDGYDNRPCVAAYTWNGNVADYIVTHLQLSDNGLPVIYGFNSESGSEKFTYELVGVEYGHLSYITSAIPETPEVSDVSGAGKRHKVYTVFSDELADAVNNGDIDKFKEMIQPDFDGIRDYVQVREFDTETEADAYQQGLDDNDGWNDYSVLTPEFEQQFIDYIDDARTKL